MTQFSWKLSLTCLVLNVLIVASIWWVFSGFLTPIEEFKSLKPRIWVSPRWLILLITLWLFIVQLEITFQANFIRAESKMFAMFAIFVLLIVGGISGAVFVQNAQKEAGYFACDASPGKGRSVLYVRDRALC